MQRTALRNRHEGSGFRQPLHIWRHYEKLSSPPTPPPHGPSDHASLPASAEEQRRAILDGEDTAAVLPRCSARAARSGAAAAARAGTTRATRAPCRASCRPGARAARAAAASCRARMARRPRPRRLRSLRQSTATWNELGVEIGRPLLRRKRRGKHAGTGGRGRRGGGGVDLQVPEHWVGALVWL